MLRQNAQESLRKEGCGFAERNQADGPSAFLISIGLTPMAQID